MNYKLEEQKLIEEAVDRIRDKVDILIDIYEKKEEYEICDILFQYRNIILPRVLNKHTKG